MKKLSFNKKFNPCIVNKINEKYFLLYSYYDGYYYLIPNGYLADIAYIDPRIYNIPLELFEMLKKATINPEQIEDVSIFKGPIVTGLMVSNACNLDCAYCIAKNANSYSERSLLLSERKNLINKLQESTTMGLLISGGEPTLNDNLPCFLSEIAQERFLCELDTNGVEFSRALCRVIKQKTVIPRISLDSIDAQIHDSVRGHFKETYENITKLLDENIEFRINTVLHNYNKDSIFDLANWIVRHDIKKWHIYKLQKTYAPIRLHLSDEETVNVISMLLNVYGSQIKILCKFSVKRDGFSSFMIDSEGQCFSSKGISKIKFGDVFKCSIFDIWRKTPNDFKLNHLKKFLQYNRKVY